MPERKRKILLIDDDVVMHDLVRAFLTRSGYDFASAVSGKQGLQEIVQSKPDLLLLDYMMPNMDGLEVYRRLREDPRFEAFRDIPVIMLTAREEDSRFRSSMLEQGVFAYLSKPFGLHELRNVIENAFVASEIDRRNRQLQEEVRRSRDYLQSVVDAAPIGIFATDAKGRIIMANRSLARVFRSESSQDFLGRDMSAEGIGGGAQPIASAKDVLGSGRDFASQQLIYHTPEGRRLLLNLRLVPQRDADGSVKGAIGTVEDVTDDEKRAVEMTMLAQIAQAMQGTLDVEELLHLILTCVTTGEALGFSRAMIFLISEDGQELRGTMGVGPSSPQEAATIWASLAGEKMTLPQFLEKYGRRRPDPNDRFNNFVKQLCHPLQDPGCVLGRTVREQRTFTVTREEHLGNDSACCGWLASQLGTEEFVSVPLIAGGRSIGLVVADNMYTGHPLDESLVQLLSLLANQAGLAIERARTYASMAKQKEELEETIQKLEETQTRLIEAERLATVGNLAAQVAHEIRNPLVTIGGFARSIIEAPKTDEEMQVIVGVIAEEAQRLETILNNVLDFTRLSKPKPAWVDFNDMVQRALFLVQEELEKHRIRLEKNLNFDLPKVYADQQQMRQVLLNLFYNAIDSMRNGGTLAVASDSKNGNQVVLEIRDTGPGMSEDVSQNMFNPFFTTKSDGTGLGLPIVQQIVHGHEGRITVDSRIGKGTTFRVLIPVEPSFGQCQS